MAEAKAKRLSCTKYPYLKIYVPEIDEHRRFEGGTLILEPDDPAYGFLLKWAAELPYISIHDAAGSKQEKASASNAVICDICNPPQVFGGPNELAVHTAEIHTAAPKADGEGNIPKSEEGPGRGRRRVRTGALKAAE